ncbi:hypothetical protein BDW59DRAFT_149273 [Aspergillus cavernicola]|uniref:Uncharacterized protein n=1 Tax=Aspergillus cavernicola TaxID=176166 RepID=A0ABR4I4J2_9EURO
MMALSRNLGLIGSSCFPRRITRIRNAGYEVRDASTDMLPRHEPILYKWTRTLRL